MALAQRKDSYRKGYAAGLAGQELTSRYKLRERQAAFERGHSAGSHGRYVVNAAIRAEKAFASHDPDRCPVCFRGLLYRTRPCPTALDLMRDCVSTYAQLGPLDRAAFVAWQSHYYAETVESSDLDLLAAFA